MANTVILKGSFVHVAVEDDGIVFFDTEVQELTFEDIEDIYKAIKEHEL